jgi:hypothetical protein
MRGKMRSWPDLVHKKVPGKISFSVGYTQVHQNVDDTNTRQYVFYFKWHGVPGIQHRHGQWIK